MSTRRQFVNMLVSDSMKCMYTLRRFDLRRNQFFHPTAEAAKVLPTWSPNQNKMETHSVAAKEKKKLVRPPPALVNMKPSICLTNPEMEFKMHCYPLTETSLFFTDSSARVFRFDADTRCFTTMPSLHTRKHSPLAISVPASPPTTAISYKNAGEGGCLYIIDGMLKAGKGVQFEAMVYRNCDNFLNRNIGNAWHCDALPLPPYVNSKAYKPAPICSYALVGGDTICISTMGVGTYCFNTVAREWYKAGDWMMPFHGKAEYDPELGLWFGVSATNFHLPCAADISGVVKGEEPPPKQTQIWTDIDVPKGWHPRPSHPTQVVSLGSGRFCITEFFHTLAYAIPFDPPLPDETFAVFTGVEVVLPPDGNGKAKCATMMKHKSVTCRTHVANVIKSVV